MLQGMQTHMLACMHAEQQACGHRLPRAAKQELRILQGEGRVQTSWCAPVMSCVLCRRMPMRQSLPSFRFLQPLPWMQLASVYLYLQRMRSLRKIKWLLCISWLTIKTQCGPQRS